MAKYPNIHEVRTMTDLIKIYPWVSRETDGTYPIVPLNVSGETLDIRTRGKSSREQNSVLRNNTGITAFPSTDFFLHIS